MKLRTIRPAAVLSAVLLLWAGLGTGAARAQSSTGDNADGQSSSSSSSSSASEQYSPEQTPSLVNPAGPTISLISSEPVFFMASALNSCGYDEGLNGSDPIRKWVRDQMNGALAASEAARTQRDKLCLFRI